MPSQISGYEYDIFVSYRQKDNRYDGWVSEFVENLKHELESVFKDEVSLFFDINPSDYLLESHDVDASLSCKLNCLIFIPIVSRTYCDPKAFAWDNELFAFIEKASHDRFGFKVKLSGGNVANRVLPIRIHDLDPADIGLFESAVGGPMRSIDFVYKEAGVNRQLRAKDDDLRKNTGQVLYRDQINKAALAIREIIESMKSSDAVEMLKHSAIGTGKPASAIEQAEKEEARPLKARIYRPRTAIALITGLAATLLSVMLVLLSHERKETSVKALIGKWEISSAVCDYIVNSRFSGDTVLTYEPGSLSIRFRNGSSGFVYENNSKNHFTWSLIGNDTLKIKFSNQLPIYQHYTVNSKTLTWSVVRNYRRNYPNPGDTYEELWFFTSRKLR